MFKKTCFKECIKRTSLGFTTVTIYHSLLHKHVIYSIKDNGNRVFFPPLIVIIEYSISDVYMLFDNGGSAS